MKHIAILGSTGSIGTQALDVIRLHADKFVVEVLTAQNNADLLIAQALEFKPNVVVIQNEIHYQKVKEALETSDIKVYTGDKALADVVTMDTIHVVLTALVGYSGMLPTINAIKAGKTIALANKETLVVAGALIKNLVKTHKINVLPVDSEHSAIFQCLVGEFSNPIEKIILTASGGPFRGKSIEYLQTISKEQALKHPNWSMGSKITIDSATLMNKGLEVIEAKWLFDLTPDQIDVVVHPQSIIHSMVQFTDGSIKAQLGLPDMKLPIQYALSYPDRIINNYPRLNFADYPTFTFEKPDKDVFKCLALAYEAMNIGGNMPCALNAANEIAVAAFLNDQIKFVEIPQIIEKTMNSISFDKADDLNVYIETNSEARQKAKDLIVSKLLI